MKVIFKDWPSRRKYMNVVKNGIVLKKKTYEFNKYVEGWNDCLEKMQLVEVKEIEEKSL